MGKGYLLDTNIVIDYPGGILPEKAHQFIEPVLQSPANTFGPVVSQTIFIRKYFKKKVNYPDAIIAASGIHFHYTLLTRNVADFKFIDNFNSINPFDL